MRPEEMLDVLHGEGVDAGADFNDGIEPMGWFGWQVYDGVLSVVYERGEDNAKFSAAWRLVPVDES